jgi:hypothetical protein
MFCENMAAIGIQSGFQRCSSRPHAAFGWTGCRPLRANRCQCRHRLAMQVRPTPAVRPRGGPPRPLRPRRMPPDRRAGRRGSAARLRWCRRLPGGTRRERPQRAGRRLRRARGAPRSRHAADARPWRKWIARNDSGRASRTPAAAASRTRVPAIGSVGSASACAAWSWPSGTRRFQNVHAKVASIGRSQQLDDALFVKRLGNLLTQHRPALRLWE